MLTFDNVRFQYAVEDFSIIDHLSLKSRMGSCVHHRRFRLWEKSTIFRLVNKLLTPASGVIRVDGESIETKKKLLWIYAAAGSAVSMAYRAGESDASDGDSGRIFEGTDAEKSG